MSIGPSGMSSKAWKLTDTMKRKIYKLFTEEKLEACVIGLRMGVSSTTVKRVVKMMEEENKNRK